MVVDDVWLISASSSRAARDTSGIGSLASAAWNERDDSIGVIELVEFLQREFGCAIAEDEITEANLGSLSAIARFVHTKRNGKGGSHASAFSSWRRIAVSKAPFQAG